jgi:hypothetical protein
MALQAGKNGEMLIVLKVRDDGTAVIEKFGETSEREGERASTSWKKIGSAVGVAAAAVATTAAIMVKNAIDTADATGKVADKLGMTTEAYSALAYTAKTTADITRDNFGQAMRMMVDNLSQAAQGTGLAKNAIADLGLNAKLLADMGPEKAVLAISDAMEKIPNQGDRVRIAMDVFRNADMVNALKGGSAAMREMMDEARRFGQVIGSDAARNADAFNDNIDRLKATATGMANQLAAQMLPALIGISNAMVETAQSSAFLEGAGKTLSVALQSVTTIGIGVASAFEQAGTWIGATGAAMIAAAHGNFSEARNIVAETIDDITRMNTEAAAQIAKVWSTETPQAPSAGGGQPAGGATGGSSRSAAAREETEKLKEELAKQLVAIHEATTSEQQLMAEKYVTDFQALSQALDLKLVTQEQYDEQRQALADNYEAKANERHANDMIRMADELTALEESLMTEQELLTEDYLTKQMLLDEALLNEAISYQSYYEQLALLKTQYDQRIATANTAGLSAREQQEKASSDRNQKMWASGYRGQLDVIGGVMSQASNLMQSGSKKQFEIGKKAAIASTLISTFQSAMNAFNSLSGIPIVGPVLGAVAAAAAIAFGMAQVGKIRSQQFQGGGAGGGAVPTFSANPNTGLPTGTPGGDVGLPSADLPPPPTSAAATTPRTVNLYMRGTDIYSPENMRDNLIPALNEAIGAGVTVNVRSL